jgi:uncharacterized protein
MRFWKRRHPVHHAAKGEAPVAEITLHCSPDGSAAYIDVPEQCGAPLTLDDLTLLLKSRHVVFGIDITMLRAVAAGERYGNAIAVAAGKPAETGSDGRLEWYIDLSKAGKPRHLDDGSVDLRDLQMDANVTTGIPLVRIIPPLSGTPGMTVYGTPLMPPPVKTATVIAGAGTAKSPDDPECIVAAIDGAVLYDGYTVEVRNCKLIRGDIDYTTGNVTFNGDIHIKGSVRAGFSVSAKGNLLVDGDVEDARISATGLIRIVRGAIGSGSGSITCGDSLTVRHLSNFTISAGNSVSVQEDALHSTITAEGDVSAKTVIGGSICAYSIHVDVAGSSAETRTILDITRGEEHKRRRYELLRRFGTVAAERAELYDKMYRLVRDGMNDRGELTDGEAELAVLKETVQQSMLDGEAIRTALEKLDALDAERTTSPLIKAGTVYPNTILKAGNEERLVRELQRAVCITTNDH